MNFASAPTATPINYQYGNEGMVMKEVVPPHESKTFIVPFASLDDTQYYNAAGVFIGDMKSAYNTSVLWINTADMTPAAKEALNVSDKMKSKTVPFLAPAKLTGNEWYRKLGYVDSTAEANEAINSKKVTEASWKRVYPSGTLYPTNLVMNQTWFSFPLVEVEITGQGKNREYTLKDGYWVRLNPSQYDLFVGAFSGIALGDNPQVKNRVVQFANSGVGTSRYTITLVDAIAPESLHDQIDSIADHVEQYAQRKIESIVNINHGGTTFGTGDSKLEAAANKAVMDYLVSITTVKNAIEFAKRYNVLADPLSESDFEDVDGGEFSIK